ncbi:MAG: hypothetical protein ACI8Z5_001831 [Lentimonas sp.]|jgi:hypothetical protein
MNVGKYDRAVQLACAASVGTRHVEFLMNRPSEGVHVPVDELYLDVDLGIRGDRWYETAWLRLPDGRPDPRVQVSLTNTAVIRCFTGDGVDSHYGCGDNLYVDFNLTEAELPVGSLIQVGEAILEVSDVENDACGKFAQRFGADAFRCVRSSENATLRLRGIFCRVYMSGAIGKGAIVSIYR